MRNRPDNIRPDSIDAFEDVSPSGRAPLVARDIVAATLLTLAAAAFIAAAWQAGAPPPTPHSDRAAEVFQD